MMMMMIMSPHLQALSTPPRGGGPRSWTGDDGRCCPWFQSRCMYHVENGKPPATTPVLRVGPALVGHPMLRPPSLPLFLLSFYRYMRRSLFVIIFVIIFGKLRDLVFVAGVVGVIIVSRTLFFVRGALGNSFRQQNQRQSLPTFLGPYLFISTPVVPTTPIYVPIPPRPGSRQIEF